MNITIKVPRIDWNEGMERHWNGNDPVMTHVFNANSFLFPQGERFFIRSVRKVIGAVEQKIDTELAEQVQKFVTQESIHTHQHEQYNTWLVRQGYENLVYNYICFLEARSERLSPLTNLAFVCAYEHYTAILGNFTLNNPKVLGRAQPNMALIWGWHSVEEIEHKAVCFDVYHTFGGGWLRRVVAFSFVSLNFVYLFSRLYLSMLSRDGCFKPSRITHTLSGMSRLFLGRNGLSWTLLFNGLRYLSPSFHPNHSENTELVTAWIRMNNDRLRNLDRHAL